LTPCTNRVYAGLMKLTRYIALVCSLMVALMCTGCDRTYGRQACRMEQEVLLATTVGVPEEVTIIALDDGTYLALWSSDAEVKAVRFNHKGSLSHHPHRIPRRTGSGTDRAALLGLASSEERSERSDGVKTFWPARKAASIHAVDMAAVSLGQGRAAVALLEQSSSNGVGGAYLAVLDEHGGTTTVCHLGPAGEYADRIAAATVDDGLVVAWHDGMMRASKIRLVKIETRTFTVENRAAYSGAGLMASPTLAVKDGILTMAWSETIIGKKSTEHVGSGTSAVKIGVISRDLGLSAVNTLATSRFVNPSPALAVSDDGLALVFRDDEEDNETPEYHFLPLNATGTPRDRRQRISTSDGLRGPRMVATLDGYLGVTIRSFQRNFLIGLNRMDRLGRKMGGEFQVYADKSDFIRVDLAEHGGQVMMVYAEDRQNKGRILAGSVSCADRE
jgi:hypothetical protein